jgi:hypothetical protein
MISLSLLYILYIRIYMCVCVCLCIQLQPLINLRHLNCSTSLFLYTYHFPCALVITPHHSHSVPSYFFLLLLSSTFIIPSLSFKPLDLYLSISLPLCLYILFFFPNLSPHSSHFLEFSSNVNTLTRRGTAPEVD